ncbi:unnamed protein product, partial [Natator depressus]
MNPEAAVVAGAGDRGLRSDPGRPGGGRPFASKSRSGRPHSTPLFPMLPPLNCCFRSHSEEPLDSSTYPAADGTPLTTTEPAQVTAGATGPGHESPEHSSLVRSNRLPSWAGALQKIIHPLMLCGGPRSSSPSGTPSGVRTLLVRFSGPRGCTQGPAGNNRETVTPPPPHELRGELRKFLEDVHGSRNKVQLALQQWGDFSQILRATRALMGEGWVTDCCAARWQMRASLPVRIPPALPMTPLTIATLNTRGCRMALRRSQVLSFLREGGYSVVFLQETHMDPTAEDSWRLEWGDRVYFSHATVRQAGVATLFSPDLRPEVLAVAEAVLGCLLHLRARMEGLVVYLVNVYAPTSGSERLQFYQRASAFLGTLDSHECLVLGGDFNTTLEEQDRSGTKQSPAAADTLRRYLLEDEGFVTSFREFWLAWRGQRRAFPSARRWWDLGKVCARLFCRDYNRGSSRWRNAAIEQLEREVLELERRLAAGPEDPLLCGACWEKREELRALEDHRARGTFTLTLALAECSGRSSLRSARATDRDLLELPLTLAEFLEALGRKPTNKSPGMDGLTVEFYRLFWDVLGPDLVTVWAESLQSGVLSLSCRRAVLALLPKKGDLRDLRNWRLVSLLCFHYDFVVRAILLRLGSVLADVIHPDQTYTVPDRSIFDNLFLVRELLELGRRDSLSFALLSLDQEKAFDRVDHGRLTGLVLQEPELRLVLSAYADDVLLVVQDPGDLAQVEACQPIYLAASSSRVNWVKSSGLARSVAATKGV